MSQELSNLDIPDAAVARAVASPRRLALGAILGLIAVGWLGLAVMVGASGVAGPGFSALGPGMGLFDRLAAWTGFERLAFPLVASSGLLELIAGVCTVDPASWSPAEALVHFAMWGAMVLAMMLPTAAPMLRTYAEIADTAAGRGMPVVSPLVLVTGYLTIWFGFAAAATLLHWLLGLAGLASEAGAPVAAGLGAVIVAAAGIYQFLSVKAACLVKCANPFPYLFANWTERRRGVFALGLRQGAYCLGCCWAMMLVMLAVGVMNIFWVAGLAVVMTVEKLLGAAWFSRAVGAGLLGLAAAILWGGGVG